MKPYKYIISGGGTGGHIFPAIAIGKALHELSPGAQLLYVGAKGRMEMEKIPEAGFLIKGLWITGFSRKLSLKNLIFPFKLITSLWTSFWILKKFKPHIVIGTGGFASGPLLYMATHLGIPTLIQEQNAYPGITNRILGQKVNRICVSHNGLERYFSKHKLVITGNPIRTELIALSPPTDSTYQSFGLSQHKKTVLILGGSLGAKRINQLIEKHLKVILSYNTQILWQCGKLYESEYERYQNQNIKVVAFLDDMPKAYRIADLIISRSGAIAISELSIVGKAVLFIPSPNVAEDHQTKNAQWVVSQKGAEILAESQLQHFMPLFQSLITDDKRRETLGRHIKKLAKPKATDAIINEVQSLLK